MEKKYELYDLIEAELTQDKELFAKRSKVFVFLRLITFFAIPTVIYLLYASLSLMFILTFSFLFVFLYLVRKSAENKEKLVYTKIQLSFIELEKTANNGDYSTFYNGERFKDSKHAFSYDLDVFGEGSIYQYLNRTTSPEGEGALADFLKNGKANVHLINEAIEELSDKLSWNLKFRAKGKQFREDLKGKLPKGKDLAAWLNSPQKIVPFMKVMQFVLPIVGFSAAFLYYFDLINGAQFSIAFVLVMLPIQRKLRKTNQLHAKLMLFQDEIKSLTGQMEMLKNYNFDSSLIKEMKSMFFQQENNAFVALNKLKNIQKQFEYRNNILVAILLNFFFCWDYRYTIALEKWRENHGRDVEKWQEQLNNLEVLISGAVFLSNRRSDVVFGKLLPVNDSNINTLGVGHPLIPSDKLVRNDYQLASSVNFSIVTGPNMAGKSTFLRSIGTALILAKAGFPVVASRFEFPELNLYSSMRTSDDLKSESSYFHAELIRLRFIVDAIERGESVFIILDEILKGTNSKDKEVGSAKFLQKLVNLKAKGIIATHDLKLTELSENNQALKNMYFDTTISGDEITFDYLIRDGVAKNMNASFLLNKMGLTDEH